MLFSCAFSKHHSRMRLFRIGFDNDLGWIIIAASFRITLVGGRFQMRNRFITVIGIVAVVLVVAGLLRMTGMSVDSRTSGSSPKTPWGEPDLQGIWTDPYEKPLQSSAK